MLLARTLLCIYFLGHFQNFSDSASMGDDNACTRLHDCAHILELVRSRKSSYAVVTLLTLLHCPDKNREIYIKCIDKEEMKDFMDRADLIPNYDQCGLERPEDKIEGGVATNIDDYPWIALLRYRKSPEEVVYGCTANLITKRYLLTAAHCVDPTYTQERIKGNISSVVLGEYDIRTTNDCLKTDCAENVTQERGIESYHIHPLFNLVNYMNDIALIRMDAEVQYTEFIGPICLPPKILIAPFDEVLLVAGWGSTKDGAMNPVKVMAKFRLREQSTCNVKNLNRKQFCAGSTHNAQTCPGDSGGPLMMRRTIDQTNRLLLIGVYSLGAYCNLATTTSIYTKVSSYVEWIVTTIHK